MGPQPVLTDGDLRLRPVRVPADVPVAVPWYQDAKVLHFSQGDPELSFDQAMVELMFREMATRCEVFIIEMRSGDRWQPIGDAALCREAGTPITIGDPAWWSHGIGTRVLTMLVDRARALGWPEMTVSGVYTDNERARRLYERAGFRITGKIPAGADRFQWTMTLPLDV